MGQALSQDLDQEYRLDFGKLHSFLTGDDPERIQRAMLFGSRPPANDGLWQIAKRAGFEVIVEDRNAANQEKKIDTGIVTAMIRDAYKNAKADTDQFTLVAGDGDYVPPVQQLVDDGFTVNVVFWDNASNALKNRCSSFVSLNPHLQKIAWINTE